MPPRHPHHDMFMPLAQDPCVYAAQLANGLVKVGYTAAAKNRMFCLSGEIKRRFGSVIERFQIVPRATCMAAHRAERKALAKLREEFATVPGTTEYFSGLDFDVAVSVLHAACRAD
jgi:hypothetical protein